MTKMYFGAGNLAGAVSAAFEIIKGQLGNDDVQKGIANYFVSLMADPAKRAEKEAIANLIKNEVNFGPDQIFADQAQKDGLIRKILSVIYTDSINIAAVPEPDRFDKVLEAVVDTGLIDDEKELVKAALDVIKNEIGFLGVRTGIVNKMLLPAGQEALAEWIKENIAVAGVGDLRREMIIKASGGNRNFASAMKMAKSLYPDAEIKTAVIETFNIVKANLGDPAVQETVAAYYTEASDADRVVLNEVIHDAGIGAAPTDIFADGNQKKALIQTILKKVKGVPVLVPAKFTDLHAIANAMNTDKTEAVKAVIEILEPADFTDDVQNQIASYVSAGTTSDDEANAVYGFIKAALSVLPIDPAYKTALKALIQKIISGLRTYYKAEPGVELFRVLRDKAYEMNLDNPDEKLDALKAVLNALTAEDFADNTPNGVQDQLAAFVKNDTTSLPEADAVYASIKRVDAATRPALIEKILEAVSEESFKYVFTSAKAMNESSPEGIKAAAKQALLAAKPAEPAVRTEVAQYIVAAATLGYDKKALLEAVKSLSIPDEISDVNKQAFIVEIVQAVKAVGDWDEPKANEAMRILLMLGLTVSALDEEQNKFIAKVISDICTSGLPDAQKQMFPNGFVAVRKSIPSADRKVEIIKEMRGANWTQILAKWAIIALVTLGIKHVPAIADFNGFVATATAEMYNNAGNDAQKVIFLEGMKDGLDASIPDADAKNELITNILKKIFGTPATAADVLIRFKEVINAANVILGAHQEKEALLLVSETLLGAGLGGIAKANIQTLLDSGTPEVFSNNLKIINEIIAPVIVAGGLTDVQKALLGVILKQASSLANYSDAIILYPALEALVPQAAAPNLADLVINAINSMVTLAQQPFPAGLALAEPLATEISTQVARAFALMYPGPIADAIARALLGKLDAAKTDAKTAIRTAVDDGNTALDNLVAAEPLREVREAPEVTDALRDQKAALEALVRPANNAIDAAANNTVALVNAAKDAQIAIIDTAITAANTAVSNAIAAAKRRLGDEVSAAKTDAKTAIRTAVDEGKTALDDLVTAESAEVQAAVEVTDALRDQKAALEALVRPANTAIDAAANNTVALVNAAKDAQITIINTEITAANTAVSNAIAAAKRRLGDEVSAAKTDAKTAIRTAV
ncbi:MAG: hypothetical protein NT145_05910, partial [Elusimicrobia bacterium]|nr:hypothetical protein [Elusimicrobiota bacterium]